MPIFDGLGRDYIIDFGSRNASAGTNVALLRNTASTVLAVRYVDVRAAVPGTYTVKTAAALSAVGTSAGKTPAAIWTKRGMASLAFGGTLYYGTSTTTSGITGSQSTTIRAMDAQGYENARVIDKDLYLLQGQHLFVAAAPSTAGAVRVTMSVREVSSAVWNAK